MAGNIAQLIAAYPGDPTGVSATIFDAPLGSLILDTLGGSPRSKSTGWGDNSGFVILGDAVSSNPTTIASGQTAVIPANTQAIFYGTITVTGTLTIAGEARFGAWPF